MADENTFSVNPNDTGSKMNETSANPLNTGNGSEDASSAQHLQTNEAQRINIQSLNNVDTVQQQAQMAQSTPEISAMAEEMPAQTPVVPTPTPEMPVAAPVETPVVSTPTPEMPVAAQIETPVVPTPTPEMPIATSVETPVVPTPTPEMPMENNPSYIVDDATQSTEVEMPTEDSDSEKISSKKTHIIYGSLVFVLIIAITLIVLAFTGGFSGSDNNDTPDLTNIPSTNDTTPPPEVPSPFDEINDETSVEDTEDINDQIVEETIDEPSDELQDLQEIVDNLSDTTPPSLQVVEETEEPIKITR